VLADTALSLTVGEDAGAPSGAVGSLISAFTGGITDVDSGASKGLAITGSNQTNGIWYYTRNGGTTWTAVGTVSNTSALLLADNASTRLYFAPNANYNGTSSAALTVRAWDQTSGTAGTKVSTASNGGTTAFSSATDTVDVTVTAVNDAPVDLSLSANTVAENAANGTVVGTVSGTDPDTGDTKTYSFTDSAGGRFAINSSTGEITVADGTLLNYEAAANHSVTVRVTDAGGLTYDETFTINLTNVNETPVAADDRAGLTFDGVDDFVDMGSGVVYEVTDTMTMEAWINREPSSQATQIIINKEGEYEVGLDSDGSLKWAFANTNPGWGWHDTGVVIPVNVWTHIAVTYDNGTITSYVNGVAVETFAGSGTIGDAHPTKDSLRIGGRENNPANQYFNGQISEAQVWNVVRTAGQIAGDLNGTLTGSETGLLGYWKFNENTGTTADNLTANSDGTLGGGVPGQTPQWATYRVNEDTTLTVSGSGVLGNDYDADGDTLSIIMVTGPSHASAFTLNPDGSFSYTPAANFSGTDSFTYQVSDGTNLSNVATVHILVDPVNDAPTITSLSGDSLSYSEGDGPLVIEQSSNALVSDVDSTNFDTGTLTVSIPAGGDSAEDVLSIRNQGTSAGQIGVSGSNVTYGGTTIGTFTGGSSGSNLVITLNSNATPTAVTALVKNITYQNTDTNAPTTGARTVRYVLTDGDGGTSANYDTTVTVSGVNDAPTDLSSGIELNTDGGNDAYLISDTGLSQSLTATTVEIRFAANDLPLETVLMSFNNPAGDELSIQLDDPSNNLEIDFGASTVASASAIDYRAALVDGTVHTLSVTWDSTAGDWSVYIDGIFIESGTGLSAGSSLDTTNGQFVFGQEQDAQNSGYDSTQYFSGTIYDVRIWNDVRTAGEIGQYYQQELGLTPAEAAAVGLVANWQMDGFNGSNQVVEIVSGNNLSIAHASGTGFTTGAVNAQLSIDENSANGSHVGFVTAEDSDASETFSYSLTDSAGGRFAVNAMTGEITVANSTLLNYEAATSHSVIVRVTDAGGLTYDETFTITLTNVNEAPTGADATVTVNEDTSHTLTTANFGFSDVDAGDSLSAVRIDTLPSAGSLTLSGVAVTAGQVITVADITAGNLVFTPAANANGTGYASVTFSVRDSNNAYDAVPNTLTVNVTAVNDPTIVTGGTSGTGNEDTTLTGTLTATDADGLSDGTVFTVTTSATNGTASIDPATGLWSYTPNADYNGTDSFTVTLTDDAGTSTTHVITLTVTAVADITNDSLTTAEDTAISANVLTGTNGATADSFEGTPVLTSVTQGANGTVTFLANGTVTYTPTANFNGTDSFTYTITSGGVAETATVTVTVTAVNDAPILGANTGSTVADGGTDTIDSSELAVTDVDNTAAQLTYTIGTGPAYGRLELTTAPGVSATTFTQADIASNRLVYVHDGSETTSDSFTFTVNDGAGGTLGPTTMTLTITPVNDTPTITSNGGGATAAINVAENVSAVTIVTGADVDLPAQALTYSISGGVDQALFTINAATGALNFTAPPDFEVATDANGDNVYVVQVQVIDSQGASTTQTIQVTVTDVAEGLPPTPTTPLIPPVLLPTAPLSPTGPGPVPSRPSGPAEPPTDALPQAPVLPDSRSAPVESHSATVLPSPTERLMVIRPEEPRETIDVVKDSVLFHWIDETRRLLLTGIPEEATPTPESEPDKESQSVSDLLFSKLDEMTASLERAMGVSQEQHAITARIAALTGTTLSAGFVAWALRSGTLLASFMATMPAWRHFDPLPVLGGSRSERERRRKEVEQDQHAEATEFKGLKHLLDLGLPPDRKP